MEQDLLNSLLALAVQTGDRLIVVDPATRQPFVLMPVSQYTKIVSAHASATSRGHEERMPDFAQPVSPGASVPTPMSIMAPVEGIDLGALARETERMESNEGVSTFSPEPATAALPDDERFYVEPLE
jgi:hypothetical protein